MPSNNIHTTVHDTIHNTLLAAGWSQNDKKNVSTSKSKFVYHDKDPYDEFILEYISPKDILITVPIPFRGSSMAYQKTFSTDNMAIILNYLQVHLGNYKQA
jgi:uncharacterized protein YaiI (UPF0178 family)